MSASIFNGTAVKILKNILRFKDGSELSSTQAQNMVSGPASSTDNALVRFDSTTGKIIQNSTVIVDDSANISGVQSLSLLADAVSSLQAVTKQQLDAAINGIQRKASVRAATTANITLSGLQTVDGISLIANDRVLVKDQTTQTENGIYVVSAGAWARSDDANSSSELNHAITSVQSGTVNSNRAYEQTTDNPTIGVSNIVWIQAYGAGTYTADGLGLELVGQTFSLELDGTTLSRSASGLRVAALGVTNAEISTTAAIAVSKLATLTASRAVVTSAGGVLTAATTTAAEIGFVNGVTSSIQTQLNGKQNTITGGATTITTANLTASRALSSDASGKVAVATTTLTELNFVNGVTSAIQTQLNSKQNTITGAATTIVSSDLTINRAVVSDGSGKIAVSATTSTELGFVSGVTSAIQTQIDSKQNTITGAATTITSADLTASRALTSDGSGKVAVSATTSTELGFVSGVTSAIQTQINSKQNTITGAATTITSSDLTINRAVVSDGSGKVAVSAVTSTELGYVSGVTSSIQTQLGSKANTNLGNILPTADVNFNSQKLVSVADPTNPQDVATKNYVDSNISNPFSVVSITGNTSAAANTTYLVGTRISNITITLPVPALNRYVTVKDAVGLASVFNINVNPNSTEKIDNVATFITLSSEFESRTFVSDGTDWFML